MEISLFKKLEHEFDFADICSEEAVRKKFNFYVDNMFNDVDVMANLANVLNSRIAFYSNKDGKFANLYKELFYRLVLYAECKYDPQTYDTFCKNVK